ncbi:MAG: 7-cyano-7-deazaguanine synthase [Candidatus Sulfotelmatobacter sp.]|nr:7-cyano-7-deazaguanine synthase [Candidatus Sulfotelmatobacter sp.]
MIAPRVFVCSGGRVAATDPVALGRRIVELESVGSNANVHICFENVAKVLQRTISPRLVDFLEIASYVYSADCATRRGTAWTDQDSTEPWGRDLAFVIPVRDLAFWKSPKITHGVAEVLSFLSNDKYSFDFVPLEHDRANQEYFAFMDKEDWPFYAPDRVIMFSGGLDSLAGAVETAKRGENLVLVSHRPVSTLASRQEKLFEEFRKEFPQQLLHVPVWINKSERFGQEPTQRTRSFLYSALGTVVAESVEAGGVRFFENGIVSLNLPVADEAIRARASRTTHPMALELLTSLCKAVTGRNFAIDNPYLFKTKTDVVQILSTAGAAHLIPHTCSCAHSMFKSRAQWHCGTCSQCIDRRFAIAAAGLLAHDSDTDYVSDVFIGPRKAGYERNMAADFVRHGIELCQRSESELAASFNAEISRAVRHEPKRSEAAERMLSMHKRHGEAVERVLREQLVEQAANIVHGRIDDSSLLSLVIGKKHLLRQDEMISENREEGSSHGKGAAKDLLDSLTSTMTRLERITDSVFAKFGDALQPKRNVKKTKKGKLGKRETVIFTAILIGHKGPKYCAFIERNGVRPMGRFGPCQLFQELPSRQSLAEKSSG